MKRLTLKKFLSLIVILSLSLGVLCFTGCKDKNDKLNIDCAEEFGICLTSSSATTVSDETVIYLEKTLTATVTADNVNADTSLVWEVKWDNANVTTNVSVTDYVKVVPVSEGSNVVKVRCYKNFEPYGNIIITVRSNVNSNVYATCIVTYKGEPTSFYILDSSSSRVDTGVVSKISINDNATFNYTLDLENLLGVGSEYTQIRLTNVEIISGNVTAQCTKYDTNGNIEQSQDISKSLSDSKVFTYANTSVSFEEFFNLNRYVSYRLSNNELTITPYLVIGKLFNGLGGNDNYNGLNYPKNGVKAMLKSQNLTFKFSFEEVKSGLKADLVFAINSDTSVLGVSKITLNFSEIEF